MPININDNEFPAGSDNTLNLIQIVKSQAHLLKKITGKDTWKDYPDLNLQTLSDLLESGDLKGDKGDSGINGLSAYQIALSNGFIGTESQWLASLKGEPGSVPNIDSLTTQVSNNTSAINAINAISRPRILWKTPRAESFTFGNVAPRTIYTIPVPAGTCNVDSILNLFFIIQGGSTTGSKLYTLSCKSVTLSNFFINPNTTYSLNKRISFNGNLNSPITTNLSDFGNYLTSTGSISNFADFSKDQTLIVGFSSSSASESVFVHSGYLELI